jgi:hypothetical protein
MIVDPTKAVYDSICNKDSDWLFARRVCRFIGGKSAEIELYKLYKLKLNGKVENKHIDWPRLIEMVKRD